MQRGLQQTQQKRVLFSVSYYVVSQSVAFHFPRLAKNHSTSQPVGRTLRLQFARRVSFLKLACVPKGNRSAACHGFLRPGAFIESASLSSTMGPGVKLDLGSLDSLA